MVGGAPVLSETLEHHSDKVNDVIYVAEDDYYVTGSKDTTLALWKKKHGALYEVVFRRGVRRSISKLGFDYTSSTLFAGFYNGNVNKYRIKDCSTIEHIKTYENQTDRVTDIMVSAQQNFIMTTSRDRTLVVRRLETMEILSSYTFADWAMCVQYCPKSNVVFVGVATGQIHLLSVSKQGDLREVHVLKGHATVVTRLLWLETKGWLCSASEDSRIVVWDIAGKNGVSYELNAHLTPVRSLCYLEDEDELLSLDDSHSLVVWDMGRDRRPAHEWSDSDTCQLCGKSFFWVMAFPPSTARQHHCRRCGMALCGSCVPLKKPFPRGGFELPVYLCKTCAPELAPEDLAPTIDRYVLPVTSMQWDEEARCLMGLSTENNVQLFKFPETELSRKRLSKRAASKGKDASNEAESSGSIKRTSSIPPVTNKREAADVQRAIDISKEQEQSLNEDRGAGSGSGQGQGKGTNAISRNGNARLSPALSNSDLEPALVAVGSGQGDGRGSHAHTDGGQHTWTRPGGQGAPIQAENGVQEDRATPSPEPMMKRRPLKSAFAGGLFDSDGDGGDSDEEESGFVNGDTHADTKTRSPGKDVRTHIAQPVSPASKDNEATFAEIVAQPPPSADQADVPSADNKGVESTNGFVDVRVGSPEKEEGKVTDSDKISSNEQLQTNAKDNEVIARDDTPMVKQEQEDLDKEEEEESRTQDGAVDQTVGNSGTESSDHKALHAEASDVNAGGEIASTLQVATETPVHSDATTVREDIQDDMTNVCISPSKSSNQDVSVDASSDVNTSADRGVELDVGTAVAT